MVSSQDFKTFHGSSNGTVVEKTYVGRELKDDELLIRITYSGVCGTDLHNLYRDMVLGHEGVGIVENTGEGIRKDWKM